MIKEDCELLESEPREPVQSTLNEQYTDGSINHIMIYDLPESLSPSSTEPTTSRFDLHCPIEARYNNGFYWFKGQIAACHDDGTFDIDYDDGDQEFRVHPTLIRYQNDSGLIINHSFPPLSNSNINHTQVIGDTGVDVHETTSFQVNEKVKGNYKGRGRWFYAKISRIHRDGTYDLKYDDGDREKRVPPQRICHREPIDVLNLDATLTPVSSW